MPALGNITFVQVNSTLDGFRAVVRLILELIKFSAITMVPDDAIRFGKILQGLL